MPYDENHAECPCCQKKAEGNEEIERLFGYRTMADGKVIPSHIAVLVVAHVARAISLAR